MTSAQRAHFEALLLAERRRAVRDLTSITRELEEGGRQGDGLAAVADSADSASAATAVTFDIAMANRESSGLTEIDAALERIYQRPDSYGVCTVCRKPISLSRLEMVPATSYCAEHAKIA